MLQQYCIQYGINGCCLRAPWIMEKDDFRYTLSFGDDVFGGPVWKDEVPPEARAQPITPSGTVPLLLDADGEPLKRNFVHVDDLASAILAALDNPRAARQLFNICMDEPVDYGEVAAYLKRDAQASVRSRYRASTIRTGWTTPRRSSMLGWRPEYDLQRLDRLCLGLTCAPPTNRGRSGIRAESAEAREWSRAVKQGRKE